MAKKDSKHILIVEDEPWLGELYQGLLENQGYNVGLAGDGYDAIDKIDKKVPDLIILDLMLPLANGIQLLQELSSHSDLMNIPVILYSNALSTNTSYDTLRHYGVRAILDKLTTPPSQLISEIGKLLYEQH